jgi:hypothetical protein
MIPLFFLATMHQAAVGWFPFVIPWDDASPSATDVSYLSPAPAGAHGRIKVVGDRFVESGTGRPIRFLGTNITAGAAFPAHADAERLAAHLAKMGINLVRFHHLQNEWELNAGGSIWKPGHVFQELDPGQLDKLDYLVAALKRHGIYVNLNLQTTRRYLPEMGFPLSVLQIPMSFDKMIDKVDRHMIDLQKSYARALLDRVNPYSGLRYRDEPALAMVEINNENSLVGWPGQAPGADLNTLPEPFRQEVVFKWNGWLKDHYGNDLMVGKVWTSDLPPSGPSILGSQLVWTWENHNPGGAGFNVPPVIRPSGEPGVAPAISVSVSRNDGPDWWEQIHLLGLTLKDGQVYTLKFRAKASQPADVSVMAGIDRADWHNVGLEAPIEVGTAWQEFSITFTPHDSVPEHDRICLVIGKLRGDLQIEDLTLCPGVDARAPLGGGSLETRTIPLPKNGLPRQMQDFARFLTEAETAYGGEMSEFLRSKLGIKANLIDTQVSWGGYTSLVREAGSDYADNHAYWQHPSFPGKDWDPVNWLLPNSPMVDEIPGGRDVLTELSRYRVFGKPYSISEYNEPAPNDYRVEMMPMLSTFAAHQGWNAIYTFEYGRFGPGSQNDRIQGFFDTGVDPVKAAFFPSAAIIFRETEAPALHQVVAEVAHPLWGNGRVTDVGWPKKEVSPLRDRLAVVLERARVIDPYGVEGAGMCTIERNSAGSVYKYDGRSKAAVGHLGGQRITFSASGPKVDLHFPPFGNDFCGLTLVPIRPTGHYLLTLASRAENQGMLWNKDRTSVSDKWGHGPVMAEGVPCDLTIGSIAIGHAWALDPTGHRVRKVPVERSGGAASIHLGPEYRTLWYELGP